MTVLVGFQGNGFSIIGSDSRATDEGGRMFVLSNKKVTRDAQDQYVFAITGACRGGNLLQQGWTPPDAPAWVDIDHLDRWMTQSFVPLMRDFFIESGYDAKWDGESATHDSQFLVSVNGIIYPIFNDYSWDRDTRGIYYDGSGGDFAMGVMWSEEIWKFKDDYAGAKEIMKKAIKGACEYNAYCAPPIVLEVQHA